MYLWLNLRKFMVARKKELISGTIFGKLDSGRKRFENRKLDKTIISTYVVKMERSILSVEKDIDSTFPFNTRKAPSRLYPLSV